MEGVLRQLPALGVISREKSKQKNKKGETTRAHQLLAELDLVQQELEAVNTWYNLAVDEDLIESYIYQMKALKAKYAHLLKQAKLAGITSSHEQYFARREGRRL
ncbi:MAG: DUF2508 family protein [Oscillospiraceae bacterium]|nr:DUF2508 family protein [Oscillospiraceae bacterium]MBQ8732683.1 DUF2508 family protein [Oscillospiraceae bacterium]